MLKLTKAIILTLILFGSLGCSQKQGKVIIPNFLTKETPPPKKPKVTGKQAIISKPIAVFIIRQDEALKNANLKLKIIRYIIGAEDEKSDTHRREKARSSY